MCVGGRTILEHSQNRSLGSTSGWERETFETPQENEWFQVCRGAHTFGGFTKSKPKFYLSMGKKISEIPKENEGFQVCRGRTLLADSRNLSLSSTSVWGGKWQQGPPRST